MRHIKPESTRGGSAANAPPLSREEALAAYEASGYDLDASGAHDPPGPSAGDASISSR